MSFEEGQAVVAELKEGVDCCGMELIRVTGISFKTQALYVVVFVTRYPDLLTRYISLYNSSMKIFFIGSSCYILYLMRNRYRSVSRHQVIQALISPRQTNARPFH